ncbi:hypothetical protein D3C86_993540 [compost metagenome]
MGDGLAHALDPGRGGLCDRVADLVLLDPVRTHHAALLAPVVITVLAAQLQIVLFVGAAPVQLDVLHPLAQGVIGGVIGVAKRLRQGAGTVVGVLALFLDHPVQAIEQG